MDYSKEIESVFPLEKYIKGEFDYNDICDAILAFSNVLITENAILKSDVNKHLPAKIKYLEGEIEKLKNNPK